MSFIKTKISAAILATGAMLGTSVANDQLDLQGGGQVKPRVTQVQVGVLPAANANCPAQVPVKAWVHSNKPGTFPILIVADNGAVMGPFQVQTHANAGGALGVWEEEIVVGTSVDFSLRAINPETKEASNWVPLTVNC